MRVLKHFSTYVCVCLMLFELTPQATTKCLKALTAKCPEKCVCGLDRERILSAYCEGSHLAAVPDDMPATLKYLDLSNNSIRTIKRDDFFHCSSIETLDLSFNKITSFRASNEHGAFDVISNNGRYATGKKSNRDTMSAHPERTVLSQDDRSNTEQLHQVRNERNTISFYGLDSINILILHHNDIKTLPAYAFEAIPTLTFLDLSYNRIEHLECGVFQSLSNLRTLNLSNNVLRPTSNHLAEHVFDGLINLKEINLQNNFPHDFSVTADDCYPDKALSPMINLTHLFIDGHYSSTSCILGSGFRNLTKLNRLDLQVPGGKCHISNVTRLFFSNISTSENIEIGLRSCSISHIDSEAFSFLPTLTSLDLSDNHHLGFAGFESASMAFSKTRIQSLDISIIESVEFFQLHSHYFRHLEKTSLKTLIIRRNHIFIIDTDLPRYFPHSLNALDISWNKINTAYFLKSLLLMPNLQIFNCSVQNKFTENNIATKDHELLQLQGRNKSTTEYLSLHTTDSAMAPRKEEDNVDIQTTDMPFQQWARLVFQNCPRYAHSLSINRNVTLPMFVPTKAAAKTVTYDVRSYGAYLWSNETLKGYLVPLPKNLQQLYMSELKLGYTFPSITFFNNKVLEVIDASKNLLRCFDGPIYGLRSLKVFDLSGNYCPAVSPYFFLGLSGLTKLYLSHNSLGHSLAYDAPAKTFASLTRLELIDLSNNNLQLLSPHIFGMNVRLRYVFLSQNSIYKLEVELSQLTQLKLLDLSHNNLYTLSQHNMDDLDSIQRTSNVTIDLRYNPLLCDCSTLNFVSWYHKTHVSFYLPEYHECTYINGSTIKFNQVQFVREEMYRICNGPWLLDVTLALYCFLIIAYALVAVIYYYKYNLYFHLYLKKLQIFRHIFHTGNGQQEMRDVFLVFDAQDVQWRRHVLEVMIPNLSRKGISYHVTETGIDEPSAGRPIKDVVEESVLRGRKTLVLLTQYVFLEEENQLAVNMAKLMEEKMHTDLLIFLGAERLNVRDTPHNIYKLLQNYPIKRYSPMAAQFWRRLAQDLKPHSFINEMVENEQRARE